MEAFIINGLRTPIGAINKQYKNIPAEDLAAKIIHSLNEDLKKKNLSPEIVIAGNAVGGGGNISRLALLKAGLNDSVAGITVDAQCASGMESIVCAYSRIKSGINSIVIAGGCESTSTRCNRFYNTNHPNYRQNSSNEYKSAQFIPEDFSDNSMIAGADSVCRKYSFTEDELNECTVESHIKAYKAKDNPLLKRVILSSYSEEKDELIRKNISVDFLKRLSPVIENGIITAGTSCLLSDGAAFITVASGNSLAKVHTDFFKTGYSFSITNVYETGANHFLSPESLNEAIKGLLKKSSLTANDIDRIDYNEAFSCVDLLYKKEFTNPSNAYGGALAYGHPYGASGPLVLLHLMCAMEENNEHYGIAAIPAAGGMGCALLIERNKIS